MAGKEWIAFAGALVAAGGVLTLPGDATESPVVRVSGRVTLAGSPPVAAAIDMSADAYCSGRHPSPVMDTGVRTDGSGGLAGVLVYVTDAPAGSGPPADPEALLDQVDCLYAPGAVALRVGETLVIRNSDQTLHNVRVSPTVNRGFNLGQPMRGIESRRSFERPEVGIPVRCDIHGWMHATVHVIDHGFYAITGSDGSYRLPDLPAGEWTVEAWHPTLGTVSARATGGGTTTLDLELGG